MFVNKFRRPKLSFLMKCIYIPKLCTKFVAPFFYNDDGNKDTSLIYNDKTNLYFGKQAYKDEYVLGIQTLFGKIGAAVVTNNGEVLADERKELFKHRNNQGPVSKEFLNEYFDKHLPEVVTNALKSAGIEGKKIKAVAVTLGPGETYSINPGLLFAKKFGVENSIPVYAVNNQEAHVFANRMHMGLLSDKLPISFPFFSVRLCYANQRIGCIVK